MSPSKNQSSPKPALMRCPYLGLREDPDTALGYPSAWNSCHHASPVVSPSIEHQREVCLTDRYAEDCPIFASEGKKALPKELRMPKPRGGKRVAARWGLVGLVLVFVLLSGVIVSGYWVPGFLTALPFSIYPLSITETAPASETSTLAQKTATMPEDIASPSPTTNTIPLTETQAAAEQICTHPLETPFGRGGYLILHKIKSGESMTSLTQKYSTTEDALDAVNYLLPSPLWNDLVIVIPQGITDASILSSLKPVFVEYDDTSIDELANALDVSAEDIVNINQINASCNSFHGWLVIPAEKINLYP